MQSLKTNTLKTEKTMRCEHYESKQCDCINGVCFSFSSDYHKEDIQTELRSLQVKKERFGNQLLTAKQIIKNKSI